MNILIDSLFFVVAKHFAATVFLIFTALLISSVNVIGALS
jgi:hypothetical protein|tara:strand:+ start:922 stop:1041 length:120 start_codon:yes stop_codon:yes gene_type:complete